MLNRSRVRAFTGPEAEQKAERVGHWFKAIVGQETSKTWCIANDVGLTKATGESTDSIGGFLAPQDFDNAVVMVRESMGAFRAGADVRRTRSDNMVRPRRFSSLTANYTAEGAAITESSLTLDAAEVSMKKIAILAKASSELFEDSAADLGEYLASEVGYAFATKEDDCGFNGDGTSAFARIAGLSTKLSGLKSSVAAASGHHTFVSLDTTDLGNLVAGVMAAAIPGACWYLSSVAYGQTLVRIAAVGGGLVANLNPDGTIASANYMGFPVRFSGKMMIDDSSATGKMMIAFGNLRMSSMLVERQNQMTISISRERLLDTDQIYIRGVTRQDIVNHSVGDSTTRGPVAVLVGTA
jgi:HK97 family phage major capsid protein